MEILHNLWNIVSTEDENLMKYVLLFLGFFETYIMMIFFTTILNIQYTKRQRNIYMVVMSILFIISTLLIPKNYSIFIHLIISPIIIKRIFKTSKLTAILAEIIPLLVTVVLESIYAKMCFILLNKTYFELQFVIIYRIPIMLITYITICLLGYLYKIAKTNLSVFENIDSYRKRLLIINLVFIIILIATQFYLFTFYSTTLPLYITLISLFSLISYSVVTMYSIIKSATLEITQRNLEQSELHNKSLELLYNNVSAFKHDFSNILTALGGFIYSKNMDGLEKYYNKIIEECHINNNLSTLNPSIINNPAVYNILASKYYKADEYGINIDLQFFINLNELKLDIYDFCRILGILLDNAIEASSQCENKQINIDFRDIRTQHCQAITIENTYNNKDIDLSRLSEKGYTSKTDNIEQHGIGLWQVSKILKKHKNAILNTSKDDIYFKQDLIIYY